MRNDEIQSRSCPTCQQPMLRKANQNGWYCPTCAHPSFAQGPARASMVDAPLDSDPEFAAINLVGAVVGGRYRLDGVLGQGAMGAVYRGVQLALTKPYAIKILLPSLTHDPQFVARFRQEARIAAAIRHPGLVEVFDYGVEDGLAYYVMELLQGQTLADYVSSNKALSPEKAVHIVAAAADAVATAHDKGVIHRDLKPANIFLARDDSGRSTVKVLDFGVSKATVFSASSGGPMTVSGSICGTPAYMSPEQTSGRDVDGRCDIYSLGIVLYRLLSGRVPFDAAEPVVVMCMHLEREVPPLEQPSDREVPQALQEVLFRSLAKSPDGRFGSMREFAAALRASVEPRKPRPASSGSSGSRRLKSAERPSEGAERPSERPERPSKALAQVPTRADKGPDTAAVPEPPGASKKWLAITIAGVALFGIGGLVFAQRLTGGDPPAEQPAQLPTPSPPEEVAAAAPETVPLAPSSQPRNEVPPREQGMESGPTKDAPPAKNAPPVEEAPPSEPGSAPSTLPRPPPIPSNLIHEEPRPVEAPRPRPAEEPRPRAKGEIAITSKAPGKVVAMVGSARLELYANVVTLVPVPAGTNHVRFLSPTEGVMCSVSVEVLANLRRAIVFGPEGDMVVQREPSGPKRLSCQRP